MLAAYRDNDVYSDTRPWLIWLHGLLGSADEWQQIITLCPDYPSLCVDLPGHGNSQSVTCQSFHHFDEQLVQLLQYHDIKQFYLIGYSLGARLAMHTACFHKPEGLRGLVIEGGHVGLSEQVLRDERYVHDHHWAQRFRHEPIESVLNDWYQQPVFAHLSRQQREQLVAVRKTNNPQTIADMLESTSLSKQPFLIQQLYQLTIPFCYFCGEQDQKFRSVSQQYTLPITLINNAGHNAHRENPHDYAIALNHFLSLCG
ncbi:2-succinyl-6-hydroxy-2,4-cyclohexadiene-1-carboxylate synthase [Providencia sneebia]|uniref:2-succinyl-6-hydroxy-2,4-cyclohexadiene-1-carboxylate synthase n=1 Tax=Providencia sneebia DSM 19967 TaxID=1141660 RepID=K8W6V4_9GAMM|nr:2-succinyl-6-hydroxy-2,4-cyclohexadiene-1-carboxylate synthase [Providencia sneebia]EKT55601.1 2-succinyl-6-hydroxy-2,4-cyclohexadiene-1-carboxylate synthase [Providencia sneebia DSM 19967]